MKTIPSKFKLGAQTINVIYDKSLIHADGALGMTEYQQNLIQLAPSTKEFPIAQEKLELVFWHEVVHWIFSSIGQEELRQDETIVEQVADRIMQVVNTMEGSVK